MFGTESLRRKLESTSLASHARHKVIVGIDYGTTFSGISYVTTDKTDLEDINIILTWPGEPHTTLKTPTRIAYKEENSKIRSNKWGFEVYPKLVSYSWTKLLLDKHSAVGEHDDPALSDISGQGMMKLPPFRDAQGVCQDFLHELYLYLSLKLRQQMGQTTFDNTPMECWITLPAIWSEEAKDATLKAAKNAGFGDRPDDQVFTIAEPEAAAIATLKKYSGTGVINAVKPNDHILVCDCGGGTVDITTYTITQVQPRLEFDELCIGVGGKCGSTYIDRNLHRLLSSRFGKAFLNTAYIQKGPGSKLMSCFEMLKRDFGLNDDYETQELGPIKLEVPDSKFYSSEEHMVLLTYGDMQSLFDPVVQEITNLIGQQVELASKKNGSFIDRIILVGGFSESPYLNKVLSEWCQTKGNIKLMCPEYPQSAVVRGAALRGLEGIAPRWKQARRHYGFAIGCHFRKGIDPKEKAYISPFDDRKLCKDRMVWAISKGQTIDSDTVVTETYNLHYKPGKFITDNITLYSTTLDDPPDYSTDNGVERCGCIVSEYPENFDFSPCMSVAYSKRLDRLVYIISLAVQVRFGDKGDNLTFKNIFDDKVISTATVEFRRS